MARHFTGGGANNERVVFGTTTAQFQNFSGGTIAAVMRRSSSGSGFASWFGNNAVDDDGFVVTLDSSSQLNYWSRTAGTSVTCTSVTCSSSDGWCLIAMTKTSGTSTPVGHSFKWPTGAWVHANFGGSIGDNGSFITGTVNVGGSAHFTSDELDGDLAALMCLNGTVLTNSEIERLASGGWSRWCSKPTDFLVEFPSGIDTPIASTANVANLVGDRIKCTSVVGTSRTALADPPGFRFSIDNRRR